MAADVGGNEIPEPVMLRESVQAGSDPSGPLHAETAPRAVIRVHRIAILAIAFACGIAITWNWRAARDIPPWPWLIVAIAMLLAGASIHRRNSTLAMSLLSIAMIASGAGWLVLRHEYVNVNDLAAYVGDEQMLVRVRGIALGQPVLRNRVAGSMAPFDYREPATYFPMRIDGLVDRNGAVLALHSAALVRVDETVAPFRAGDRIETIGFLLRPVSPLNPGEFDYREYAKSLGQAGILTVPRRELLSVTPADRNALAAAVLNWRDEWRRRAGAWLLSDLPESRARSAWRASNDAEPSDSAVAALLSNLMLGERDAQIDSMYESFQRVGLAHILAISGFHLAVLAGFSLSVARLIGGHRRWHGLLIIAIVLLYLFLIEVHMPVLRAGIMTIAGSIALLAGRRLRAGGLVSLSAILLLMWRPDQLFNAGFQLTYGVVLGLIYLSPPLRQHLFGKPNPEAATVGEMVNEWLKTLATASIAAWMVATPIAMFHFGMVSPLGIVMSIVAVPLSAVILALGFVKIICSAILPSVALMIAIPLSMSANLLLNIVNAADSTSMAMFHVPYPGTIWTLAALAWVIWWVSLPRARRPREFAVKYAPLVALVLWLEWPAWMTPFKGALRIDMLAVGDGSCYIVRSGDSTAIFDAGSSTDLNVGKRSLIPAMRRLGVRHIDLIAVSHADLDHYSAVLELVDEFDAGEVLVTPHFMAEARGSLGGPAAHLIGGLTQRRVAVVETAAGVHRELGQAGWRWLNPRPAAAYEKANDSSMVIQIQCAGRRILLCGDIQSDAMNDLLFDIESIRADIVELPHHGSHHDVAEAFIDRVHPSVVMQSTGWSRWSRDRWAKSLSSTQRLVTARDGACWVEIDVAGTIQTGRFLKWPNVAAGAE